MRDGGDEVSNVIVTGGAGYIGAHTCKALFMAGFTPVVVDNLETGHRDNVQFGKLVDEYINNQSAMETVRAMFNPVGVIHLAALSDVAESMGNPARYEWCNIKATEILASAMKGLPMVFASSASVYASSFHPRSENSAILPGTVYGRTKAEGEALLPDAMRLRYFNVCGAGMLGELPERHEPETHLIPRLLAAIRDGQPFTMSRNGSQIRDYVHVLDVAEANVKALQALLAGARGEAINICTGFGYSVLEVCGHAGKVTRGRLDLQRGPTRLGDCEVLVGDKSKAASAIGWVPRYDLRAAIESAWAGMTR